MTAAGWEEGQPLAGSKDVPKNSILESFLTDGGLIFAEILRRG